MNGLITEEYPVLEKSNWN